MKIEYVAWKPTERSAYLVDMANNIIEEYAAEGYTMTLRQLYYQFVARAAIENTEKSYNNLGKVITKARLAGMLSWEAIEDRNREHHMPWYQENERVPIRNLPYYIQYDRWERQPNYIEVWVEKEALGNVVERACDKLLIPHMACKGYLSASEAWRAGRRFKEQVELGKSCILIHLGDHDPSGIDMTRDNDDRMALFSGYPYGVEVDRIALNINQVRQYNPPPNPTKLKDSRAQDYIKKYGKTSWELDALEPKVIEELIRDAIEFHIDWELWDEAGEEEQEKKQLLEKVYEKWDTIKEML